MQRKIILFFSLSLLIMLNLNAQDKKMKVNPLTPEEERVIVHKGTERPYSGKYYYHDVKGTYLCKRCEAPLYRSDDKFDAQCGWPSFDEEITGAVERHPDSDGMRTEIVCKNCGAHLGHVFIGEGFTKKNTRHCVNSLSLHFISSEKAMAVNREKAIFAGGCFWGVEHYLEGKEGVISATSGYIGGTKKNPAYKEVCSGTTGHAEAVEVVFDPSIVSYEELARLFFEIHDPTQINRQGPDIGYQYRSAVFYNSEEQRKTAEKLINILKDKGYKVVTTVEKAGQFWVAEDYHQDYYQKTGKQPYCHFYQKRF